MPLCAKSVQIFDSCKIPVDSSSEPPGGGRMAIETLNRDDSSPSITNQRPYDEVYQTPRFRSSDSYRNCQARLASSRHLRQDDAYCSGLSHLQNISLSADLGCSPPIGNAL